MANDRLVTLTAQTFDAAVSAPGVAVVEFYADWCLPCGKIGETLLALQTETPDGVRFYRADADAESALSDRYGVLALPAILIFRDGRLCVRSAGPKSRRILLGMIEEAKNA